jgi:hypothetical protein
LVPRISIPSRGCVRYAVLLLAAVGTPAHHAVAIDACYSDAVGEWRGPVLNGLGIEDMTTSFALGTDGMLIGRYRIEDTVPLDGTLTDFRETGPCAGDFRWSDRDGSGTVHISFQPENGRFLGRWGSDRPMPGNVFNGYRRRAPAVS